MATRVNKAYLLDRVRDVERDAETRLRDESNAGVEKINQDWVKNIPPTWSRDIVKMTKAADVLHAKQQKVEKAISEAQHEFGQEYRYLQLGRDGSIRVLKRQSWEPSVDYPKDLLSRIEDIREEYGTRSDDLKKATRSFTDQLMMGSATYEDFQVLIEALKTI